MTVEMPNKSDLERSLLTVSVIIPCYNRSDIIARAIVSVLRQTYPCDEIIVVDDGSSDAEQLVNVLDSFNEPRLWLVKHAENLYQPAASNTGIKAAKGELVAFLDSDDEWLPDKIEKQIHLWCSLSNKRSLIYTQSDIRSQSEKIANIKIWPQRSIAQGESVGDYLFLNRGFLQTSSILIARSIALEVQFDEAIPKHTDYNLLLRLEDVGVLLFMVEKPLVIVHWEGLHSTTRDQTPEKSLDFLRAYREYLSPKAETAFCLQQIVFRQLRVGNRLAAWQVFRHHVSLKSIRFLDMVKILSFICFSDERLARSLASLKSAFQSVVKRKTTNVEC